MFLESFAMHRTTIEQYSNQRSETMNPNTVRLPFYTLPLFDDIR